jgi:hypothetical protein
VVAKASGIRSAVGVAIADGLIESADAVGIPPALEDARVWVDRIADLDRRRAPAVDTDRVKASTVNVILAFAIAGVSVRIAAVSRAPVLTSR